MFRPGLNIVVAWLLLLVSLHPPLHVHLEDDHDVDSTCSLCLIDLGAAPDPLPEPRGQKAESVVESVVAPVVCYPVTAQGRSPPVLI